MPAMCPTCLVQCSVQNIDGSEVYQCPACHNLYPKMKSAPAAPPPPPRTPPPPQPAAKKTPSGPPIEFSCPNCGHRIKVPGKFAGKKGQCEKCKLVLKIPSASTPAAAPLPPAQEVPPTAPLPVVSPAPTPPPAPAATLSSDDIIILDLPDDARPVPPAATVSPPAPAAASLAPDFHEELAILEINSAPATSESPAAVAPPVSAINESHVQAVSDEQAPVAPFEQSVTVPVEQPQTQTMEAPAASPHTSPLAQEQTTAAMGEQPVIVEASAIEPPATPIPETGPASTDDGLMEFEIPVDTRQPTPEGRPELLEMVTQEPESITTEPPAPTTPSAVQETPSPAEPGTAYEARITHDDGTSLQYYCPRCNCFLATPVERRGMTDQCPDCKSLIQIPLAAIRFACHKCSQTLDAPIEMSGLTCKCPACGAICDIPMTPAQQRQQEKLLKAEMARMKSHHKRS